MAKVFSLNEFKEAVKNDKIKIFDNNDEDMFYPETGQAIIHEKNIMKYLEKFMCKDINELSDFLYYKKGIFLKVI